jgi:hypothetical protein
VFTSNSKDHSLEFLADKLSATCCIKHYFSYFSYFFLSTRGDAHTQNAPVEGTGGVEEGHQPRALVNGGGGTYNPRSAWLFVDSKRRVLPDIDGNTMSLFYNRQRRHSLSLFPEQ